MAYSSGMAGGRPVTPNSWTAAAAPQMSAPTAAQPAALRPGSWRADDAWTALDEGQVTLTDDELFELAETHGITTL